MEDVTKKATAAPQPSPPPDEAATDPSRAGEATVADEWGGSPGRWSGPPTERLGDPAIVAQNGAASRAHATVGRADPAGALEDTAEAAAPSDISRAATPAEMAALPPVLAPTIGGGGDADATVLGADPPHGISGRTFGDYDLICPLARGGMGIVYRARQRRLNRVVALKMILSGDHASEDDKRRLQLEAEAAAHLEHPGIVPIYEAGEIGGQHFFSMGFIDGGSLEERLKTRPLPPRQAAAIVRSIAEAVDYAHRQGIVHRDLKPSNVLIDRDGNPKVSDFGLAKRLRDDSHLTASGTILGTPSFMAPEQAAGRLDQVGPLSDVYGLGAILYRVLVGRPPFNAASPVQTLKQVMDDEPVAPRQQNRAIDTDLETICLKCLQKEPSRRYDSAQALADDLGRWLRGEAIVARPVGAPERMWRWCRRNKAVATLIALVACSLCIGTVVSTYFALRERAEAQNVRIEKRLGDRRWYGLQFSVAHRAWRDSRLTSAQQAAAELAPGVTIPADLRGFEARYLDQLFHLDLGTWRGHEGTIWQVAFEPRGRWLASAGHDHSIRIWNRAGAEPPRVLAGHKGSVTCLAIAPDGERLVSGSSDGTLRLWQVATGAELAQTNLQSDQVSSVGFRPDGRRIIVSRTDGALSVHDAQTLSTLTSFSRPRSSASRLSMTGSVAVTTVYSPDGRCLARAGPDETVTLLDADTGAVLQVLAGHQSRAFCVAFVRQGRELVSSGADGTVRVWDRETGRELQVLGDRTSEVYSLAVSADGRRIAAGAGNSVIRVWDRDTGEQKLTLRGHSGPVLGLAFSDDGRCLASSSTDGTVKIWDAVSSREFFALRGLVPEGPVRTVAFRPDGKRLAFASALGVVYLWDPALSAPTLTYAGHKGPVLALAFSPDGRWLATAGRTNEIRIWDTATGDDRVLPRQGSEGDIRALAFSPDGSLLASGGMLNEVLLWEWPTGRLRARLKGHRQTVCSVSFAPDGATLASLDGSISPQKSGASTLKLWDVAASRELASRPAGNRYAGKTAFSPDGRTLAVPMAQGAIELLDPRTLRPIRTLRGHVHEVMALAYSHDGSRVVSASFDSSVKLWDSTTGHELLSLNTGGMTHDVALTRDDLLLAAAPGGNCDVRIWGAVGEPPGGEVDRNADSLVRFLFEQPLVRAAVIARIQADPAIGESTRRRALAVAAVYPEDVRALHRASWTTVLSPRIEPAQARVALEQAQAACRIGPDRYSLALALALACFRAGDDAEALAALARAESLAHAQALGPEPLLPAVRAMTLWHQGQQTEAGKALDQLALAFQQNPHAPRGFAITDDDVRAIVTEARSLCAPTATTSQPHSDSPPH